MKLSDYAKQLGISYKTAWRWYKAGKIQGYQASTGTIIITEDSSVQSGDTVLYARVSSSDQKEDLLRQLQKLRNYASASGLTVSKEVSEIASGLNDNRPKLNRLLSNPNVTIIIVEHKDRLTRFGFNYINLLMESQERQIIVINESDTKNELVDDFIAVITSMCARIYGKRSAKRKANKVKDCIENA